MNAGKVQQEGAPLDVYRRPANSFVAGFLGSPPMNQVAGRVTQGDGGWFEADGGGFRLRLPDGLAPAGIEAGRAVLLGIRPEDLHPAREPAGFEAVVEEIEPLGHEALVSVRAGSTALTLRGEAGLAARLGQPLRCAVEPGGLHWFDLDTGNRIGP
jgi:ABC-type sugar transport system ATPase subunit